MKATLFFTPTGVHLGLGAELMPLAVLRYHLSTSGSESSLPHLLCLLALMDGRKLFPGHGYKGIYPIIVVGPEGFEPSTFGFLLQKLFIPSPVS